MLMDKKKKIAQLIIARLDGKDINKKYKCYQSLVKKGIGGFIIFDGKLKEIHRGIKRLQDNAEIPLFFASDLEQGLGQHIESGTLFPPAMAIGQAINPKNKKDVSLLRKTISIIAQEAKAAGINIIFSPVLDVNTNPKNPIICTRAFSDNPKKVAWFGNEFIRGLQRHRIIACAKHFPGHGDTIKDSHKELPVIKADIKRLQDIELYPFSHAIKAGVKMIMVGHLKVPVLDSKFPSTLSQEIIQGLLREKMQFKGLVITDAMNMHAIRLGEGKACLMALNAGADIILHPGDPEKIIDYLSLKWDEIMPRVEESFQSVIKAKKELTRSRGLVVRGQGVGTKSHWDAAKELTQKSIKINLHSKIPLHPCLPDRQASFSKGDFLSIKRGLRGVFPSLAKRGEERFYKSESLKVVKLKSLIILIIDDDDSKSGDFFIKTIKNYYPKVKPIYIDNKNLIPPHPPLGKGGWGDLQIERLLNSVSGKVLIAAVFSKISAWKGRSGLSSKLKAILEKSVKASGYSVIVGFCCPYSLSDIKADAVMNAYSGSELAQEAAAKALFES